MPQYGEDCSHTWQGTYSGLLGKCLRVHWRPDKTNLLHTLAAAAAAAEAEASLLIWDAAEIKQKLHCCVCNVGLHDTLQVH